MVNIPQLRLSLCTACCVVTALKCFRNWRLGQSVVVQKSPFKPMIREIFGNTLLIRRAQRVNVKKCLCHHINVYKGPMVGILMVWSKKYLRLSDISVCSLHRQHFISWNICIWSRKLLIATSTHWFHRKRSPVVKVLFYTRTFQNGPHSSKVHIYFQTVWCRKSHWK